ncbi:PLP-dependent transferase [Auriculariales sp. MPI-PUGE-AT-0066]|nr:PLP-dependent transferase [Auriculariales sp. MPI-PUGE-AT-0066]
MKRAKRRTTWLVSAALIIIFVLCCTSSSSIIFGRECCCGSFAAPCFRRRAGSPCLITSMANLNVDASRGQFPSLKDGYLFGDNAGGSQCLKSVADAISDYLLNTNAQLGATYSVSAESTSRVQDGLRTTATLVNAASPDEITFGSSSTVLVENLARAIDGDLRSTEEFIVSDVDHEANVGAWKRLAARRGLTVHHWKPIARSGSPNENPYNVTLRVDDLLKLVTAHTRLVAFTACSNILGELVDITSVVKALRARASEVGARKLEVCIDCVAYAPHRRIDVQAWDVDYAFFSYYKVYGAHVSALYTRATSRDALASIAHYFLTKPTYKLAIGGPLYEMAFSTTPVLTYLESLDQSGDADLDKAFATVAKHETTLMQPLLDFLLSDAAKARGVRVVGPETVQDRVPTVSFVVIGDRAMKSADVVAEVDKAEKVRSRLRLAQCGVRSSHLQSLLKFAQIGIRYGHFYAHNLLRNALGIATLRTV